MTTMFFVTTFEVKNNQILYSRCIGYYENYNKAAKTVMNNNFDIHEGCYNYALIEAIPAGSYPTPIFQKWFRYAGNDSYTEIPQPEFAEHVEPLIG